MQIVVHCAWTELTEIALLCLARESLLALPPVCRRNAQLVEQLAQPQPGSTPLHFDRPYAATTWQQFDVLMRRWLQSYWRHPLYNATRFAYCVLLGIILGTVYLWKGSKR
jgi:hypothetical protein